MVKEGGNFGAQEVEPGIFIPSKTVLKAMVREKSNYKPRQYDHAYTGDKKVLVVCTEDNHLEMENGNIFLTGNHPIETFVPMLHMQNAGYSFEIATPTGKPVQFEEWAAPKNDPAFNALREMLKSQLEKPARLADIAKGFDDQYAAVFIPGGHGALIGLPECRDLKPILEKAMEARILIVSLCHGPAAFLAAGIDTPLDSFIFNGYEILCNPDAMDKQLSRLGYLPGKLKYGFSELLEGLGVRVENNLVTGKTHADRNVITGDGPPAADELGQLAANTLLMAAYA